MLKLDFGCGDGGFQEISEDRLKTGSWVEKYGGGGTFAIDCNAERIEKAKSRIKNGTKFLVCDGTTLPFPDNYFDIVHESGTLHHMPNYKAAIKELARVTKPYGKLLLKESVDNDPVFKLLRRVLGKWQGDDIDSLFTSYQLDEVLSYYFNNIERSYYWRFTISDILRMVDKEPQISLSFNQKMSCLFNKIGIGKETCSHYVVKALKYCHPKLTLAT